MWNVKPYFSKKIKNENLRKILQVVICRNWYPACLALGHCCLQELVPSMLIIRTGFFTIHNLYHFSADDTPIFFFSCKLSPILHWRQFAWNVKSCLLGKTRKIFQNVAAENFTEYLKDKYFDRYGCANSAEPKRPVWSGSALFATLPVDFRHTTMDFWISDYHNNIISIGTDWAEKTVYTQIRHCRMQHLIKVYTVYHSFSSFQTS